MMTTRERMLEMCQDDAKWAALEFEYGVMITRAASRNYGRGFVVGILCGALASGCIGAAGALIMLALR